MLTCPKCGSTKVYRSKTRSAFERWRREITGKAPFRCHRCAWRGWRADVGPYFSREEIEAANRALTRPGLDPGTLEVPGPAGWPRETQAEGRDVPALDQVFKTSPADDRSINSH